GLTFGVEAVEELRQDDSDVYNQFILLKSKYNDLMYMSSINTLSYEQISLGLDKLRNHLMRIIDEIEGEHLGKESVEQNLNISALPTRRANFFKLLDIHYLNINAIHYIEYIGSDTINKKNGRNAVFEHIQSHRRRFQNKEKIAGKNGNEIIRDYFAEWFQTEIVGLEVYIKNIKHMLQYALASEVEQEFFLDTLRSLFTRYEQAFIFYYAFSEIDLVFNKLMVRGKIVDESVKVFLIRKEDYEVFFN
ncbi:MAG: hypothetical protein AAF391_13825, partial [Bacteroidota bacterium]